LTLLFGNPNPNLPMTLCSSKWQRGLQAHRGRCGLDADELLQHGAARLVYAVQLAENAREYLVGRAKRLVYKAGALASPSPPAPLPQGARGGNTIAEWWIERWVAGRIAREEVLARIDRQTLVHPIRHAARVVLPEEEPGQGRLFER